MLGKGGNAGVEKRKPFENVGNNGKAATVAAVGLKQQQVAPLKALGPSKIPINQHQQQQQHQQQAVKKTMQPLGTNKTTNNMGTMTATTTITIQQPTKPQPKPQPVVHLELLDDDEDIDDDEDDDLEEVEDASLELLQDQEGLCNMSLEESMNASLLMDEPQRLIPEEMSLKVPPMPSQVNPKYGGGDAAVAPATMAPVRDADVEDIDELDDEDPQCVVEYVNDIYQFLRVKEARYMLDANYMRKTQNDLTPGMRAILLDWLADVGLKFKLLNDTTHMTVMLVDRYLATKHNVSRKQLQLVGVACMLIASKYEEIYAPEVRDFEFICDGAFTKEQILQMEVQILNTLNFDVCHPTPLHFLRRYSKAARSDSECHTLAKYLTELAAVHYESLVYAPSLLAAAAVLLARSMHPNGDDEPFVWSSTMRHYTGYKRLDLLPAVRAMIQWGRDVQGGTAKLTAVYRKYSKRFFGVALIPFPEEDDVADEK